MPFTATHVAAAVPIAWLCRWRVPFSALAIGAVVSDIPVFYPGLMDYRTTHTMVGVATHCVPVGVFVYYFYQLILKRPLADLLPRNITARLWPWIRKPIDFSPWAIVLVFFCVALGAATHVVWDSFTHRGRWGVEMFPVLGEVAMETSRGPIHWYAVLQHASSALILPPMLLGFLLWVRKLPHDHAEMDHAQMPRGLTWAAIAWMVVGAIMYCQMVRQHQVDWTWTTVMRHSVKDSVAVILAVTLAYCFGMHYVWWKDGKRWAMEAESS